jgi:transcription termination/antitermination protein NusG
MKTGPNGPGSKETGNMAKRWYSVSVLSNFEKKVAEQIKTAVAEANLGEEIDEVLVPTEEVIEVRRGKKVTSERRFMPGYVLVHMEMSNRGYHLIRFDIGETVQVTDGPFEGFSGMVEDVDETHSRLKVTVSIFGRATPVELEFTQVSKGN